MKDRRMISVNDNINIQGQLCAPQMDSTTLGLYSSIATKNAQWCPCSTVLHGPEGKNSRIPQTIESVFQ